MNSLPKPRLHASAFRVQNHLRAQIRALISEGLCDSAIAKRLKKPYQTVKRIAAQERNPQ